MVTMSEPLPPQPHEEPPVVAERARGPARIASGSDHAQASPDPEPPRHAQTPTATSSDPEAESSLNQESAASATVNFEEGAPTEELGGTDRLARRYKQMGMLGHGASGEVRQTRDRALNRLVAMKTLRTDLASRDGMVNRFVREARIVAQLEHPAIVPVHDLGQLPDGRWYIIMKEVHGRTLRKLVKELHEARGDGPFAPLQDGWTFRRVIDAFRTVCSALGFAHTKGVLHRDVKPDNIMIGSFGEVLLVDWGLAKVMGEDDADLSGDEVEEANDSGVWLVDEGTRTRHGVIVGTPAYMSPEQARGDTDAVGIHSDIWSLGGVLYTILYGRAPYRGRSKDVLRKVAQEPPRPVDGVSVPEPLVDIWRKAMRMDPAKRYPDAKALIADIDAWVEGSRARAKALALIDSTRTLLPGLRSAQSDAASTRDRARAAVRALRNTDSLATKEAAWALEQESERLQDRVESLYLEIATQARLALAESAGLPEARRLLAEVYRERADDAERVSDRKAAREYRALLAEYDDGRHADYLRSDTLVTLETEPPGAQVMIHQVRTHARRLVTRSHAQTGPTPLHGLRLPVGQYLLEISHPDCGTVRYPIDLRRGEPWEPVPPGGNHIAPVILPARDSMEASERLVSAGWFWFSGDAEALGSIPRQRLWVDAFTMQMGPVTNIEYLAFLNDLVAHGRFDISTRYLPCTSEEEDAEPLFLWDDVRGRWVVPPRAAGLTLQDLSPVVGVSWHDAQSYCMWLKMKTGLPWRLPSEVEREKAARGVDGRAFPWGSESDPAFHCMEDSPIGSEGPPPVSVYPIDTSPYGIMGLAGGVREWCGDVFRRPGPPLRGVRPVLTGPPARADLAPNPRGAPRVVRGGAWGLPARACRAASRSGVRPTARSLEVGFRVCRSLDEADQQSGGSKR